MKRCRVKRKRHEAICVRWHQLTEFHSFFSVPRILFDQWSLNDFHIIFSSETALLSLIDTIVSFLKVSIVAWILTSFEPNEAQLYAKRSGWHGRNVNANVTAGASAKDVPMLVRSPLPGSCISPCQALGHWCRRAKKASKQWEKIDGKREGGSLGAFFQMPHSAYYPAHFVKNRFSCQNVGLNRGRRSC